MSLMKPKANANYAEADPKVYPTWGAFVQDSVERTNELLSQLDQDALRKLIESAPERNVDQNSQ